MIKIISLIIVIAFTIGCSTSNIKRVGKKEFLDKAQYINLPAKNARLPHPKAIFIGATKTQIYIQYWKHWSTYPQMKTRKTWIYITQIKLLTSAELVKISRSLKIWPFYSKPNANPNINKYIGIWKNKENKKDVITIEKNGRVKPWKNATWDITKNNGIIIMFKSDTGIDIIKAQLNKAGELIILTIGSNPKEYIRKLPPKAGFSGFTFEAL